MAMARSRMRTVRAPVPTPKPVVTDSGSGFDTFFMEALAKTGDRQQYQLVGECSLKVKNEKAHFKFNALT